jgi:chromosome segregation ATPase
MSSVLFKIANRIDEMRDLTPEQVQSLRSIHFELLRLKAQTEEAIKKLEAQRERVEEMLDTQETHRDDLQFVINSVEDAIRFSEED